MLRRIWGAHERLDAQPVETLKRCFTSGWLRTLTLGPALHSRADTFAARRITVDEVAWNLGVPLIRVTVDGMPKVLQYLGASGEVSKAGP